MTCPAGRRRRRTGRLRARWIALAEEYDTATDGTCEPAAEYLVATA